MKLDDFISSCKDLAVKSNSSLTRSDVTSLKPQDLRTIFSFAHDVFDESMKREKITSLDGQADAAYHVLVEAAQNLGKLSCRDISNPEYGSDFKRLAVGALTTLGESALYQHKKELLVPETEIAYDVPERTSFIGMCAKADRVHRFRVISLRPHVAGKEPELGTPGYQFGIGTDIKSINIR
ncbi:MAG TPA: hypothetical protein VKE88_00500 [Candidatus Nanoarchaeia archaeon]|nr:hypothetical protein [Candidatus Nanoarchaeia archaeon]